jgi:hypothetical protein
MSGVRRDPNELTVKQAIAPQSIAGATVNGSGVDCNDFIGPVFLEVSVGANATSVDCKAQESDVVGSGYADLVPAAAAAQITIANTSPQPLRVLRTKRFIRAVCTTVGTAIVGVNLQGLKRAQ